MPPPFFRCATLFALLLVALPALSCAQPRDVYPVRSGPSALSLNGQWDFKYVAGEKSGGPIRPDATITVPGHWELQGFAEPKYGKDLAAGTGFYRRNFRVPDTWKGQRVFLLFEGVLFGFTAWVNGTEIGSWASGYNPVTFDVTDHLKPGADNVLTVEVTTRSHGWEFDTNDCWSLSGIYRDVTLFAVPSAHFTHYTARTKLNTDGTATLTIATQTSAPATVSGRLLGPDGQVVGTLAFASDKSTAAEATLKINEPRHWTAETPALYTLELTLSSGQHITEKIGLREIGIVDGVLQLNGRPIKLRGVNHHDLWPDTGRATDEAKIRRDLELIKAANCNLIRTSHYPPHPRFLELCDELGLYVIAEVPFGYGEQHLNDPAYQEDLFTRARATLRRDHNRPSIIVWSVGNENENTPLTFATARRVKELDPSRPVCFPQMGTYFITSYKEIPADIDIYAPHYPSTAIMRNYAARFTRPVIFTEYAHALGLATDQLQVQWPMIQQARHLAGGAIWMFQDQGILRRAQPAETPATSHELGLYVWPDAQSYYDTHGNKGMDGLVYSDRQPQTDYWQLRKVYSPVQIATESAPAGIGANRVVLPVENHFDFRSLGGITLAWSLHRNGAPQESHSVPLHAAAHATENVAIEFTLPQDAGADVFTLTLRCMEGAANPFYERTVRLKTLPDEANRVALLVEREKASPLRLSETSATISVAHSAFNLTLDRTTGEITLADSDNATLASGFLPHIGRRFTEGEFVRREVESTWIGSELRASAGIKTSAIREGDNIVLRVRGRYPRPDAAEQGLEGELRLTIRPNGLTEVVYDYTVTNSHGLMLETGLSLLVPASASEFRWIGAGPYAGYPDKDRLNEPGLFHLGRADLHFQGNRRGVEIALLTKPNGAGVAIGGLDMDVAVERRDTVTALSHNALVSGRGTKFHTPDLLIKAHEWPRIVGHFTLLPLTTRWPTLLSRWFGDSKAAQGFQPYYHSYDQ